MRQVWPHVGIVAAILGGGAFCALLGEEAYWWYTGEDRFAETLQVIFFTAAVFHVIRARAVLRERGEVQFARLYLVTALAFVFLIGEEISWGQRIFGWGTPEGLARINRQDETTIHNIEGLHQAVKWALLLIGLYGTALPLWARRSEWAARHRWYVDLLVPPLRHIPYFLSLFVWRIYRNLFPLPEQRAYAIVQVNEILELVMAVALFLFFRHVNGSLRREKA